MSGYGRPVIQPIVSRCTISKVLEKYYKGWKKLRSAALKGLLLKTSSPPQRKKMVIFTLLFATADQSELSIQGSCVIISTE